MERRTKKFIGIAGIAFGVVALSVISMQRTVQHDALDDVPLPFGFEQGSPSLAGSVSQIGVKNGVAVKKVLFPEGTDAETLNVDEIYLVLVPDDESIQTAALDDVFTTEGGGAVNYFGYKYSSADAALEKANKAEQVLTDRFPGQFFASAKARSEDALYGDAIANFETINSLTMSDTDTLSGATLTKNSLYFVIVNEASGATLTVRTPPPVTPLTVAMNATTSSDTAVANQNGILLARFTTLAGNDDVLFTSASFVSATGSLSNAENYTLWTDTDADGVVDTVLEQGVVPTNNEVIFTNLASGSSVITSNAQKVFEVHADVVSSLVDDELQLRFNSDNDTTYINAELLDSGMTLVGNETDGTCNRPDSSPCDIVVTTASTTHWTFQSQGDLYVTLSSTPTAQHQLVAGTLGDSIFRLTLRAEVEDIDVTLFRFSTTDHDVVSFEDVELYFVGEQLPFAVATAAACGTGDAPGTFCASMQASQLVASKGTDTTILLKPHVRTDTEGAVAETVQVALLGSMIQPTVEARGVQSSNNLVPSDGDAVASGEIFIGRSDPGVDIDVVGTTHTVVFAKIVNIGNANSDTDNSAVPTGVSRIGSFAFTAYPNTNSQNGLNDVVLTDIIFTIDAHNVQFDDTSFKVFNAANQVTTSPCTVNGSSSSDQFTVSCTAMDASIDTEVNQNATIALSLQADIVNNRLDNGDASAVRVSFDGFNDATKTGFGANQSHIQWKDTDALSSQTLTWFEYDLAESIFSTQYNLAVPVCGNGLIESGEQCDDSNTTDADGCSAICAVEFGYTCTGEPSTCGLNSVCGNGIVEPGEQCDDNNLTNADGCSNVCTLDPGYSCTGEPSTCTQNAVCGNGLIESGEQCDDSNTDDADGCSAVCATESGYSCTGEPSVCTPEP